MKERYVSKPWNFVAAQSISWFQEDPAAERDHKIEQNRGGFILKAQSEEPTVEKKRKTFAERKEHMKNSIISGLRLKKQRSTGDIDQKVSLLGKRLGVLLAKNFLELTKIWTVSGKSRIVIYLDRFLLVSAVLLPHVLKRTYSIRN